MPKKRKKKKSNLSLTYPCTCGHTRRDHVHPLYGFRPDWCQPRCEKSKNQLWLFLYCSCEKFNPDNLKYLELMAKKKRGNKK